MKKSLFKHILIIFTLSSFLAGCDKGNFRFLGGKEGYWGDENYYFDENEDDNWSFGGGNNSNDSHETSGSDTFDENSTLFGHSFASCESGEVAIYARTSNCLDEHLIVPSKYVDSSGTKYQVAKDCNNGFGSLPAKKITLPNGFKEIDEGFSNCVFLTTLVLPSTLTKIEGYALTSCVKLTKIEFKGTKEQWNAIEKGSNWNYLTPTNMVVSCSNGNLENQGWSSSDK